MKTLFTFAVSLAIVLPTAAQMEYTRTLDGNSINARIGDQGRFFHTGGTNAIRYEIPAGSGKQTFFNASLLTGALDINGMRHISGPENSGSTWYSGPIADVAEYGTPAYINAYGESIWKVTRQEVEDHIQQYQQQGYVIPTDIANWPGNGASIAGVANQLAPFVDLNGDGIYDPAAGDYPDFPGDQVVYTIINDEGGNQPDAMGIEAHMMFYQYNMSGYLQETTFLNLRVFNRGTIAYYDFLQMLYFDMDIGNVFDDYVGTDTSRNMFYTYNGDQLDEVNAGTLGYGSNPPCQGVVSLNHDLFSTVNYSNGPVFGSPSIDSSNWNTMYGLTETGDTIIDPTTNMPTTFTHTGNPFTQTGWYETAPPSDRRGTMTINLGNLPPQTSACSDFAFIFDDTDGHLENVQNVMYIADALQSLYDSNGDFPCGVFTAGIDEIAEEVVFTIYPNPSSGSFSIQLEENGDEAQIQLFDLSGRLVLTTQSSDSTIDLQLNENPGVYSVVVKTNVGVSQKLLVLE